MGVEIEKIDLIEIDAPLLTDVNYGENIKKQFDNINFNFQKLSNSGFTKGKMGESIKIKQIKLSKQEGDEGYYMYKAIKDLIENTYNEQLLAEINGVNWYDDLDGITIDGVKQDNYAFIYTAIIDDGTNSEQIVSMIPLVLKDSRFNKINYTNIKEYENIEDVSCLIGFNYTGPNDNLINNISYNDLVIINTQPTLYFDSITKRFCWKVWGKYTGLIASGPTGQDGQDGDLIICIRGELLENNKYEIVKIISNGEVFEVIGSDIKKYEGKPAIIIPSEDETLENKYAGFWTSTLNTTADDKLCAMCSSYNNILTSLTITPEYFIREIAPYLNSYYLSTDDSYFNIKTSDDEMIFDKTNKSGGFKEEGNLKIELNTKISPYNNGAVADNEIEVTNKGIYIKLGGVRYSLSAADAKSDTDEIIKVIKLTQV